MDKIIEPDSVLNREELSENSESLSPVINSDPTREPLKFYIQKSELDRYLQQFIFNKKLVSNYRMIL